MELLMELGENPTPWFVNWNELKSSQLRRAMGYQQFGQAAPGVVGTVHFALELETIQQHLQQASQSLDLSVRGYRAAS